MAKYNGAGLIDGHSTPAPLRSGAMIATDRGASHRMRIYLGDGSAPKLAWTSIHFPPCFT